MVKVAVLGYGTVGSGVVEVLEKNKESIAQKAGTEIEVKYVLDLRDFPGNPIQERIVHDYQIVLQDEEIEVVAEAMGGLEPAHSFAVAALNAGKSYCTSNKEMVEKYGPELLELAKEKNQNFLFEASVGGGIPIIRPLNHCLTADEIEEITGILNGTTNYILTKMSRDGSDFASVLKEAQELGYAERNPAADIEGHDACRKIAILASLAFGMDVDYTDIYMEGITKITDVDFKYAAKLGLAIKLLGSTKKVDGKIYTFVAPAMLTEDNPLYAVHGVFNGILVRGNQVGDLMFYGSGAGKLPTASAVVSDVIDAVKHKGVHVMTRWSRQKMNLADFAEAERRFFVRVKGTAEAVIETAKNGFGADSVLTVDGVAGEAGFITAVMSEKEFAEKAAQTEGFISRIRLL